MKISQSSKIFILLLAALLLPAIILAANSIRISHTYNSCNEVDSRACSNADTWQGVSWIGSPEETGGQVINQTYFGRRDVNAKVSLVKSDCYSNYSDCEKDLFKCVKASNWKQGYRCCTDGGYGSWCDDGRSVPFCKTCLCNNNNICDGAEDAKSCANDCGCNNNGKCELNRQENASNCANDCGTCGNGICNTTDGKCPAENANCAWKSGETAQNCAQDCQVAGSDYYVCAPMPSGAQCMPIKFPSTLEECSQKSPYPCYADNQCGGKCSAGGTEQPPSTPPQSPILDCQTKLIEQYKNANICQDLIDSSYLVWDPRAGDVPCGGVMKFFALDSAKDAIDSLSGLSVNFQPISCEETKEKLYCNGTCKSTCNKNGFCEPQYGETKENCPQDCVAQPGICNNDGVCDIDQGETPQNCQKDCVPPVLNLLVLTTGASSTDINSAVLGGRLQGLGEGRYANVWFEYYPCSRPDYLNITAKQVLTQAKDFTDQISNLAPNTEYCYAAIGQEEGNGQIVKGETLRFFVAGGNLQCPKLITPEDGSNLETLLPTLQWEAIGVATNYILGVRQDIVGGALVYNKSLVTNQDTIPTGKLSWGKTYYWNVEACQGNNCTTGCPPISFTAGFKIRPPNILSPSTTIITDIHPTVAWEYVPNAQFYEYIVYGANNAILEQRTLQDSSAVVEYALLPGDYLVAVRGCADSTKINCSDYSSKSFTVKNLDDVLSQCSTLLIGTTRFRSGYNQVYLRKCASGVCPTSYENSGYQVMQEYPVDNQYTFYLLDEVSQQKYYSNDLEKIPQGKKMRLMAEPMQIPSTNYADGLAAAAPSSEIKYIDSASSSFVANEQIDTYGMQDSQGVNFNLGIAIDDPFKREDLVIQPNEYFQITKEDGKVYAKPIKPTASEISPEAQITITVPKVDSYQVIDNDYLNSGCIAQSQPQTLSFGIFATEQLNISGKYLGNGNVKIDVEPSKDGLKYSLSCHAQSGSGTVQLFVVASDIDQSLFVVSIPQGVKIDSDITCDYVVSDTIAKVDYSGSVKFSGDDLSSEVPLPPVLSPIKPTLCADPAEILVSWQNQSEQAGYQMIVYQNGEDDTRYFSSDASYGANSLIVKVPGDGIDNRIDFTGKSETYYVKVKIMAKNGKWSEYSEAMSFDLPKNPLARPIFDLDKINTYNGDIRFRGRYIPTYGPDGQDRITEPNPSEWQWFRSKDSTVWEPGDHNGSTKTLKNAVNTDIYLRLRFIDYDTKIPCDYETSTRYSNTVQFGGGVGK